MTKEFTKKELTNKELTNKELTNKELTHKELTHKEFTKKDLKTGDVIVLRNRELGVVIAEKEAIMYQNVGIDFFDSFTEDLRDAEPEESGDSSPYSKLDIMEVRRAWGDSVISFEDHEDSECVYRRDDAYGFIEEQPHGKSAAPQKPIEPCQKRDDLTIIAQAFYGNRTMTYIRPEDIDRFIRGILDSNEKIRGPIDRTVVRIPGTDNLVLVYNKYQEQEYLDEVKYTKEKFGRNYVPKPTATIPELNLTLYHRCIVLRMNANGEFESLESGDFKKFMKYLAR